MAATTERSCASSSCVLIWLTFAASVSPCAAAGCTGGACTGGGAALCASAPPSTAPPYGVDHPEAIVREKIALEAAAIGTPSSSS